MQLTGFVGLTWLLNCLTVSICHMVFIVYCHTSIRVVVHHVVSFDNLINQAKLCSLFKRCSTGLMSAGKRSSIYEPGHTTDEEDFV